MFRKTVPGSLPVFSLESERDGSYGTNMLRHVVWCLTTQRLILKQSCFKVYSLSDKKPVQRPEYWTNVVRVRSCSGCTTASYSLFRAVNRLSHLTYWRKLYGIVSLNRVWKIWFWQYFLDWKNAANVIEQVLNSSYFTVLNPQNTTIFNRGCEAFLIRDSPI